MKLFSWVMLFMVVGATSGCLEGGACTLIGCVDGVRVAWEGVSPPGAMAFSVVVTADGVRHQVNCATASAAVPLFCESDGVRFQGSPRTIVVEATAADGRVARGTFSPTYTTSRPNGPDCEPVCRSATVLVRWTM